MLLAFVRMLVFSSCLRTVPFKMISPPHDNSYVVGRGGERFILDYCLAKLPSHLSIGCSFFSSGPELLLTAHLSTRLSGGRETNCLHRVWLGKFCSIPCMGLRLRLEQSKRVCGSNLSDKLGREIRSQKTNRFSASIRDAAAWKTQSLS
jgi:hypothetical protein